MFVLRTLLNYIIECIEHDGLYFLEAGHLLSLGSSSMW